MAELSKEKLEEPPEKMLSFTVTKEAQRSGARLGRLALGSRNSIATPHYIGNTSRGAIPHIMQDMQHRHTEVKALYMALEDFVERTPPKIPPILQLPAQNGESPLRRFTGHSSSTLLVLGPRRVPPVEMPLSNSNTQIGICTSTGFRHLSIHEYVLAAEKLRPDIVIGPGDIVYHEQNTSQRRREKMCDRTQAWMKEMLDAKGRAEGSPTYAVFAPIHPIPIEQQMWYLNDLCYEMLPHISGLSIYDAHAIADLPKRLQQLPRLGLTKPDSPLSILRGVSQGIDLSVAPFITLASDAGIALDFAFPAPQLDSADAAAGKPKSLGMDMWDQAHSTDVGPLIEGCSCYACQSHHRAYIQHLLQAKEMLAWVLLQLHNHHVMDVFYAGIRASIENGSFEEQVAAFERFYEAELPEKTGKGPRVRGYQTKSIGRGEPKKNSKAYNSINDMTEALPEAEAPSPGVDANDMEEHGMGGVAEA